MDRPTFRVPHWFKIIFVWLSILLLVLLLGYQIDKRLTYLNRHVLNVMQPFMVPFAAPIEGEKNFVFAEKNPQNESIDSLVIYHFWATWCVPCRQEIPTLNELQAKMGEKVRIVAIAVDESKEDVVRFFAGKPPLFDLVWDPNKKLSSQFNVQKYPESFIHFGSQKHMIQISGARQWDSKEAIEYLQSISLYQE